MKKKLITATVAFSMVAFSAFAINSSFSSDTTSQATIAQINTDGAVIGASAETPSAWIVSAASKVVQKASVYVTAAYEANKDALRLASIYGSIYGTETSTIELQESEQIFDK